MLMEVENDNIRYDQRIMNTSLAELCRRIGQTPQNFNKKLQRGTVFLEEMVKIAEVLDVGYAQAFVLQDGEKINLNNRRRDFTMSSAKEHLRDSVKKFWKAFVTDIEKL